MGYDCYTRPRYESRNDEDYRQWHEEQPHSYFRRNMWGGDALAEALIATGMGFDATQYAPIPPWPDATAYDVRWTEWQDDEGEWHDGFVGARAAEYETDLAAHLAWHGPEIPGIPVHKVCGSNDGWHVTKEECKAALVKWAMHEASGGKNPEAFDDDFLPFLREAARGDGFEVH